MPEVKTDQDFQTQMDMETLSRAEEITRDPGRVQRIRRFAERQATEMAEVAKKFAGDQPRIGEVRGGMKPRA